MPAAFILSIGLVAFTPAKAETFSETLENIARKNPRILSAQYLARAAEAEVGAARAAYRPQLGVTTDLGWSEGSAGAQSGLSILPEVRVSQLVYDGGRTPAEIRRRRIRVGLLGVQEQAVLADVSLQLAQAWLDLSRASELAGVSEQQIAALMVLDNLVTEIAGFDRGRGSDVVMVRSRLEQARTTLVSRRIALTEARARIREVAALPVEPEGALPDLTGQIPGSAEECRALAEDSPTVRIADLQVREGKEAVSASRNWWAPQLAVEAARTSERTALGDTRLLNGFAFRLRTSVLPFDSGGGKARLRAASASLESARAGADFARQQIADQAQRLWVVQAQRRERLPAIEDLVRRADEARDIVFEQFRIGRRTILDVLAYDLERFNVRAQLVNERFDAVQAQYQLMGALGRIYPVAVAGAASGEERRDG